MVDLNALIRDVPDFPKEGIVFKDITPLWQDAAALKDTVDRLAEPFEDRGVEIVAATEARGYIIGPGVAMKLGAGFVPVRKPGKLPYETIQASYELEYGTDSVEVHTDAVREGQKVLMVDDLLATGGTMAACCELVERLGGVVVGCAFIVELSFLNGSEKLSKYEIHSLIDYAAE